MFPSTLYVYRDSDDDVEWFMAEETPKECVRRIGDPIPVGIYELTEQITVSLEIKVEPVPAGAGKER